MKHATECARLATLLILGMSFTTHYSRAELPAQPPGLPDSTKEPTTKNLKVMQLTFIYVTNITRRPDGSFKATVSLASGGQACATGDADGKDYLERSQKRIETWERRNKQGAQEAWAKSRAEQTKKLQTSGFGPGITYDPKIKIRVGSDVASTSDLPPDFTVFCEPQSDGCYRLIGNRETVNAAGRSYAW
jgi:hypothetical protein